jgi:uncharacterized protein YndB with AHSA1/START domain
VLYFLHYRQTLPSEDIMQNTIQREITINASKERVYEAIANPAQVTKWFPERLEGDYKAVGRPIFGLGEYGKNPVCIVAAQPHEYFAFRWVPGANNFMGDVLEVPNTLVEFQISPQDDGTCKVTLTDSGFADLPAELMEAAFKQNSGGWDFMLGRFEKYFEVE